MIKTCRREIIFLVLNIYYIFFERPSFIQLLLFFVRMMDEHHVLHHGHPGEYVLNSLTEHPSSSQATEELLESLSGHVVVESVVGTKRPASRPIHVCWAYFTNEHMPWLNKRAICKNCHKEVCYWKKAQTVLGHLKSCQPFREAMHSLDNNNLVPEFCQEWTEQELRKQNKMSSVLNQHKHEEAFSYLHNPNKLIPQRIELVGKLLDEYGVEGAGDMRFLDDSRKQELAKCLKFVPERKFLELLS